MKKAPIPENEADRLMAVKALNILDTKPEPRLDAITKEATVRLHVPISTISIIDKDREWYKSCQGLTITEGPRDTSFCGHAMSVNNIFVIEDTHLDKRFKDNPAVINAPFIRFYAGMSLYHQKNEMPVGVFCIKDTKPRKLTAEEIKIFLELAAVAEDLINISPTPKIKPKKS